MSAPLPFACADFTFPLLSHTKVLDLIALLEFDGVDIGLFEGRSHLWPSREFQDTSASARALKRETEERGLKVADVFLQMAPDFEPYAINHPEAARREKAREWFRHALDYASECGCMHVTILPGVAFPHESRDASLLRAIEELAWRIEKAREQGIVFGVEAHTGSIVSQPHEAEELVKLTPGLTLTLDYTHFTRAGLPDSEAERLLPYASHFHVRGAREGRLQTAFKDNVIDYKRVVELMRANDYRGYLGIEYVWIDWEGCNEVDNLSETLLFRNALREYQSAQASA